MVVLRATGSCLGDGCTNGLLKGYMRHNEWSKCDMRLFSVKIILNMFINTKGL